MVRLPFGRLAALSLPWLLLAPLAAQAHPHSWIDVRTTLQMADGRLTALDTHWEFDELYTAYIVEDLGRGGRRPSAEQVAGFAARMIDNLKPYGYFIDLRVDGQPHPFGTITQARTVLRGGRLSLRFTAPLARPVDPARHPVSFSIFDPTYFIDMQHRDAGAVRFQPGNGPCRARIEQPRPSAALLARALDMDRDAPVDDTLGRQFAQVVTLACTPP